MTGPLTLVSFDLCPYVQRAAIVLAEKEVPFERINVDLANKPEWFKTISPTGKVPLLRVGDDVLFESSVIVEYLEETQPNPLHPQAPLSKARHRAWMEFGSTILGDIWIIETTPDVTAFQAKARLLKEKFTRLENILNVGPYFAGEKFSIVDAVFAPVFRYFDVFDRILDLGVFEGLPKVQAWRRALATRPSVANAVVPNFKDLLSNFLCKQKGYMATLMT
jgi:glutathione S-transferase